MDARVTYRTLIERILTEYSRVPYSHGTIDIQVVFDRQSDHYLLVLVGRNGIRRVHGCLVHVDIIDGKIWIQRDGTEYGIARELIEAGVPQEDIVLAFRASERRTSLEVVAA